MTLLRKRLVELSTIYPHSGKQYSYKQKRERIRQFIIFIIKIAPRYY